MKEQKSNKDFQKLTTVTSIKHLNKLNSIILSQNKIIDNINRKFTICLKRMKDNYSRKINMVHKCAYIYIFHYIQFKS
ncbi:hypothetical protein PFFCH_04739 [Plasmodium falciparum FCH/4]|uniref:Uncharacterized protein n=1 Tax=Plasmodium falciparum FCH/4 TaxID=1036724 RepID=A0A024VHT1_PLAFA|nr:hypothetical protein PFFCH_04739 [Plasmodium falciparum FCH/4]